MMPVDKQAKPLKLVECRPCMITTKNRQCDFLYHMIRQVRCHCHARAAKACSLCAVLVEVTYDGEEPSARFQEVCCEDLPLNISRSSRCFRHLY